MIGRRIDASISAGTEQREENEDVASESGPGAVVKIIEVVGSSPNSFSDAVRNAVKTAAASLRNIKGVDVMNSSADVDQNGELVNYKVTVKIAFVLETSAQQADLTG